MVDGKDDDKPRRPPWMSDGRWATIELFRENTRTGRTPKRRMRAKPTAKIIPFRRKGHD